MPVSWKTRWRRVRRSLSDIFVRTAKTFVATFGSVVTADAFFKDFDPSFWESAFVTALSAAVTVVWNAAIAWSKTP